MNNRQLGNKNIEPDADALQTLLGLTPAPVGAVDHGALIGLLDDDHPQYLRTDGTRALADNLAVAPGKTIDGVDISALAASLSGYVPTTRQVLVGSGLSGGGALSADVTLAVDGTVARSTWAVNPGSGLSGGGNLAAAGITLAVDGTVVRTTRSIGVSGLGLSGGGTLAADRTITLASSAAGAADAHILASDAGGSLALVGLTLSGDIAVNGGDLTTTAGTFNLLNAVVTTINAFGAATSMRLGTSALSIGVNKAADPQFDLDVNGNLRAGGYIVGKHAVQLPGALMIAHYDGAPPYTPPLTDFTGNPTGHLGQVATQSGGVIFLPGQFGKAVQVAEATTNRFRNPSYETNTTDWVTDATGTLTRDSTFAYVGSWALKWHWTSGALKNLYTNVAATLANSTTYTTSFYARRADGGVVSGLTILLDSTGAAVTPTITDVGSGWYRVVGTKTTSGATNQVVGVNGIDSAVDWYFDGWQLEQKGYPTPYCDGSLGTGHSWTGTAHASTSTRTVATLSYPTAGNISGFVGSVSLWFYALKQDATGNFPWQAGLANADLDAYLNATQVNFRYRSTTSGSLIAATVGLNAWHHVVMTWDWTTNQTKLYLDGVLGASGTTGGTVASLNANMGVGYSVPVGAGANNFSGWIDDFVVLNRVMSAAEVAAVYQSNAPVFAETSVFSFRDASARVWMDSNGVFAKTPAGVPAFALTAATVNTSIVGGASETLDPGDVLIGDNNVSKGNMLFDASTGKVLLRGGTIVQGNLDTSGALAFGLPPPVSATSGIGIWLDRTGLFGLNTGSQLAGLQSDGRLFAGGGYISFDHRYGLFNGSGQMKGAGTIVNDTTVAGQAWTNPSNATAWDATYATVAVSGSQVTNFLKATNFGFAIPATATITGVMVEAYIKATIGANITDNDVRLVKGGAIQTTNVAWNVYSDTTPSYIYWGGPASMWGTGLTVGDVNGSGFGAAISMRTLGGSDTISVDYIRITVYYQRDNSIPADNVHLYMQGALVKALGVPSQNGESLSWGNNAYLNDCRVLGALTADNNVDVNGAYKRGGVQVVTGRVTGYTNQMSGTANRATAYATGSITLVQLAERVKAIEDDLLWHGLIGA